MQISSVSTNFQRLDVSPPRPGANRAEFAKLVEQAADNPSAAVGAVTGASSQTGAAKANFRSMTPSEFAAQAQAMYDRGEIDIQTLGPMLLRAHSQEHEEGKFGSVGGGKFDYVAIFQASMDLVAQQGRKDDPTSGYAMYQNILSKIS